MDDSLRAKFVHISDLLTQIGEGIGKGNNALVVSSQTPYGFGTLAVKTAQVKVDFALTSSATSAGLGPIGVGANTLLGFGVQQQSESSRASITLDIVPIALTPAKDAGPGPVLVFDPSKIDLPHLSGWLVDARKGADKLADSDPQKAKVVGELTAIDNLLKQQALDEAAAAIKKFAKLYPGMVVQQV